TGSHYSYNSQPTIEELIIFEPSLIIVCNPGRVFWHCCNQPKVDLSSLRKNSKRPFNTIRAYNSHERFMYVKPCNPEGVPSTKGRFDIGVKLQNEEILTTYTGKSQQKGIVFEKIIFS
ncbi:11146_t:CDS:2, partial [Funneliformis geosporum]